MDFSLSQLSTICVGILIVTLSGCGEKTESEKSPQVSKSSEPELTEDIEAEVNRQFAKDAPSLPDDAPVEKFSVAEFVQLRNSTDKDELLKRFDGKWIEISGVVAGISIEEVTSLPLVASPVVILSENGQVELETVPEGDVLDKFQRFYCRNLKPWDHFHEKDKVTLRGILTTESLGSELILDSAKLISSSGTPMPKITASELAKAFEESPTEAEKKYPFQQYVVTGKVKRIDDVFDALYLEGHGQYEVLLEWAFSSRQEPKIGDTISVLGNVQVNPKPFEEGRFLSVGQADNITHFSIEK